MFAKLPLVAELADRFLRGRPDIAIDRVTFFSVIFGVEDHIEISVIPAQRFYVKVEIDRAKILKLESEQIVSVVQSGLHSAKAFWPCGQP